MGGIVDGTIQTLHTIAKKEKKGKGDGNGGGWKPGLRLYISET